MPRAGLIRAVEGRLMIDGAPASLGDPVPPNAQLTTSTGGKAVVVAGEDAFLLRGDTQAILWDDEEAPSPVVRALTLISGAMLSVFGPKPVVIDTPVASIGIRGTGIYLEAPMGSIDEGYVCLCYGVADLRVKGASGARETLATKHHDAPRFIRPRQPEAAIMKSAPVLNHTDAELVMLERLVGRKPPFVDEDGKYDY